jgi:hypothetical protein
MGNSLNEINGKDQEGGDLGLLSLVPPTFLRNEPIPALATFAPVRGASLLATITKKKKVRETATIAVSASGQPDTKGSVE